MAKDSVLINKFSGLQNTVGAERLTPQVRDNELFYPLEKALNTDIDDVGEIHKRRGSTLVSEGSYHSLFEGITAVFVVKNGDLCRLNPNYTTQVLKSGVGDDKISYVQVGDEVYFSSRSTSGIIEKDLTVSEWGAVNSEGIWISPVVNPTDTLPAIKGKLYGKPPMATALSYYNGRIYMAYGNQIWATELYLYKYVDKTKNYFIFEDDITDIGCVTDGLYVGTKSAVYFMSGQFTQMARVPLMQYGMMPGSLVSVPAELIRSDTSSKSAVIFLTETGLCAGFDSGVCYNLTQTKVLFPEASNVSAMFRRLDGMNQYIGVADSAGSPNSTARIGDYVDAEIRRFQGV